MEPLLHGYQRITTFPDVFCDHVYELSQRLPIHLLTCPPVLSPMEAALAPPNPSACRIYMCLIRARAHTHINTQAHRCSLKSSAKELWGKDRDLYCKHTFQFRGIERAGGHLTFGPYPPDLYFWARLPSRVNQLMG